MKTPRIALRQATSLDMLGCARVFLRAATDLSRRQGVGPPQVQARDMATALAHIQRTDPKGFQVAVRAGKVVAFAATILRGRTHFLSMFWTLPSLQSKGIGRRVLARAFERPRPPASRRMLAVAARFDQTFRATRRDADLRFVMSLPGARFYLARAGRTTIGYAIVNAQGRLGPAGVIDPRYAAGLAWAMKETARELGAKTMIAQVPGVNAGALDVYFRAGMRAEFFGAWMSERPVGSFEGYLLAGGMLL